MVLFLLLSLTAIVALFVVQRVRSPIVGGLATLGVTWLIIGLPHVGAGLTKST